MLPPSVRVYIATTPTDVRKSFDGLSTLVAEALRHDPLSGHGVRFGDLCDFNGPDPCTASVDE
jgi:transposase